MRTLNLENGVKYPNILKIFEIVKIRKKSTEAETAASGIRRLRMLTKVQRQVNEREVWI